MLLSHADRTRFVSDEHRKRLLGAREPLRGSVLWDGRVAGTWSTERDEHGGVRLVVHQLNPLGTEAAAQLEAEGRALVDFLQPDATAYDFEMRSLASAG